MYRKVVGSLAHKFPVITIKNGNIKYLLIIFETLDFESIGTISTFEHSE